MPTSFPIPDPEVTGEAVKRITSVEPITEVSLYDRISLELSHTWPGQIYLRFEPHANGGPAIMIQVKPGDIAAIARLGNRE